AGPRGGRARHGVRTGGWRRPNALRGAPARCPRRQPHALHAAGRGRGGVACDAAAARCAAAGALVREGLVGPGGGRQARRGARPLGRSLVAVMTEAATIPSQGHSAAAPSPFPPIADYAFLSNCHTGALIAADGAIDSL